MNEALKNFRKHIQELLNQHPIDFQPDVTIWELVEINKMKCNFNTNQEEQVRALIRMARLEDPALPDEVFQNAYTDMTQEHFRPVKVVK